MSNEPVEAKRAGPGNFLLAAEQVAERDRFRVGEQLFEVASKPRIIGTGRYLAQVRRVGGPAGTFGAYLWVGQCGDE